MTQIAYYDQDGNPRDRHGRLIRTIPDGGTVRVDMLLCDSVQKAVADGGQADADYAAGVADARRAMADNGQAAYEARIADAWRRTHPAHVRDADDPTGQAAYEARIADAWRHGGAGATQPTPATLNDNGQAAYEARVRDAWRAA